MRQTVVVLGSQNTAMMKEYFEHFVLKLTGVYRVGVAMFANVQITRNFYRLLL